MTEPACIWYFKQRVLQIQTICFIADRKKTPPYLFNQQPKSIVVGDVHIRVSAEVMVITSVEEENCALQEVREILCANI